MATKPRAAGDTAKQSASDPGVSYDAFKEHEGQRYTGMKVGRSHTWHYDPGVWKETKVTPDLWQIGYAVTKRRAGRAPEGSGVPVGTEYHWYVVAHQHVAKLNANDYTTSLAGVKFKVAHKRAGAATWNATTATQRRRMIRFLHGIVAELEQAGDRVDRAAAPAPEPRGRPRARTRKRPARRIAKRPRRPIATLGANPRSRRRSPSSIR